MGYYTSYSLSVTGPEEFMDEFKQYAGSGATFGQYDLAVKQWLVDDLDEMKWYDWKDDVADISERFPFLLFEVTGEGEEAGDLWHAYARNGKVSVVRAQITFPKIDVDAELPTPDIEDALAKKRAEKIAAVDAEIARLESVKQALDGWQST